MLCLNKKVGHRFHDIDWYRSLAKETCVITGYYTYTEKNLMPQDKSLIEAPSCSLPSMYLFFHRSYLSTMHKNNKNTWKHRFRWSQKWGPYPTIENRHDFFKGASVLDKPIVRAPPKLDRARGSFGQPRVLAEKTRWTQHYTVPSRRLKRNRSRQRGALRWLENDGKCLEGPANV